MDGGTRELWQGKEALEGRRKEDGASSSPALTLEST